MLGGVGWSTIDNFACASNSALIDPGLRLMGNFGHSSSPPQVSFLRELVATKGGNLPTQSSVPFVATPSTAAAAYALHSTAWDAPMHSANTPTIAQGVCQLTMEGPPAKRRASPVANVVPPHNSSLTPKEPCPRDSKCLCCPGYSPVKLHVLLPLLDKYPQKDEADCLRNGLTHGFKLGYSGPREGTQASNSKSGPGDPPGPKTSSFADKINLQSIFSRINPRLLFNEENLAPICRQVVVPHHKHPTP